MEEELGIIEAYQIAEKTGWTLEYVRNLSYLELDTIKRYTAMMNRIEKRWLKEGTGVNSN